MVEHWVNTGKLIYNMIDNTIGFENALMILGAAVLYVNRANVIKSFRFIIGAVNFSNSSC